MGNKSYIIAIDFDGTCVEHKFPKIGKNIGAEFALKALTDNGHRIILYTMRSNKQEVASTDPNIHTVGGNYLDDAVEWFKMHDIPLWGVNENPEQKSWTSSPKPYADYYIDDSAVGMMLTDDGYVNWSYLNNKLFRLNLINEEQYIEIRQRLWQVYKIFFGADMLAIEYTH